MNQVAFILENTTIYWYSVIVALSVLTGICFFLACCRHVQISGLHAAAAVLISLVLSLVISRLLYWYCRADSFENLLQALTTPSAGSFALAGAFFGCGLTALVLGKLAGNTKSMLDCMSIAGCGAIALGRLGFFFTSSDRGQILTEMISIPWAYPVLNPTSGIPEYRLATFLFQAILAGVLFVVLISVFFSRRGRQTIPNGDYTLLFLLVYSASQIILDSTRYDSLYLRSNGFISIVQILCAVVLGVCIILLAVRAVKVQGLKKWMPLLWLILAGLFGIAGYMEYFVQRHGKLAFFSYDVMEHCLVAILCLSIYLWKLSLKKKDTVSPEESAV